MINTLKRASEACAVAFGRRDIRNRSAGFCASAEPGATRRHQIPVPLGLYGALLQRAAGRRGLAAMPAEEHVEPFIELPERGARRGSAGGGDYQAGRNRGAESRCARGCNERRREIRRAKGRSRRSAGQPTSAQISAIRSACRSDYPKVCAGVPTGGAPALQCLEKNKAKLSAGCEKAVSAASGGGAAAPAAGAAPAAAGAQRQPLPLHRRRRP